GQGPDSIVSMAVDGGEKSQFTTPGEESVGDMLPTVSPDGRRLAWVRVANRRGGTDIYVQPVSGGSAQRLTHDAKSVVGLAWCGDRIVFASNRAGGAMLWTMSPAGCAAGAFPA